MRRMWLGLILLGAAAAGAQTGAVPPEEFTVITKSPQRYPIAVPDFLTAAGNPGDRDTGQRLTALLRQDFQSSAVLRVVDPRTYLAAAPAALARSCWTCRWTSRRRRPRS